MVSLRAFDFTGIAASALCLVHCIGAPLLLAVTPTIVAVLPGPAEWLHAALLALALPTAAVALVAGYRRHGSVLPAVFGGTGLFALVAGLILSDHRQVEVAVTILGSLCLAVGHVRNWQARRSAG